MWEFLPHDLTPVSNAPYQAAQASGSPSG